MHAEAEMQQNGNAPTALRFQADFSKYFSRCGESFFLSMRTATLVALPAMLN
jgi:hypothetical protein